MAPEVMQGSAASDKADVFGLGVVLWECLTAGVPFAGANIHTITLAIVEGKRPPIPPACPRDLARLVQCMWDASEARRPTAAQALQALMALEHDGGGEQQQVPSTPPPQQHRQEKGRPEHERYSPPAQQAPDGAQIAIARRIVSPSSASSESSAGSGGGGSGGRKGRNRRRRGKKR